MTNLFLRELQCTVCPVARRISDTQRARGEAYVRGFLNEKPVQVRVQLSVFLLLIQLVSILRCGKRFQNADSESKVRILRSFQDAPIGLIRKGFWGLSTILKLSVYGDPEIYPSIHFQLPAGARTVSENGA